jgi:hypothetical protein
VASKGPGVPNSGVGGVVGLINKGKPIPSLDGVGGSGRPSILIFIAGVRLATIPFLSHLDVPVAALPLAFLPWALSAFKPLIHSSTCFELQRLWAMTVQSFVKWRIIVVRKIKINSK